MRRARGLTNGPRSERSLGRLFTSGLAAGVLSLVASCESEPPPPPSDPELRAELGIPDDVRIHRIDLSGRGSLTRVLPPEVTVLPGEIVQLVVLDNRVYLVEFETDRMPTDALRWLQSSEQDHPPPLVETGARLVLSFEGAPQGRYPFRVIGNGAGVDGAGADGAIVVAEEGG